MESLQIYLNSKYADKYNNGNIADCEFNLPMIEIPEGFYIYISVVNANIPFSFYNINSTNNILKYSVDGGITPQTIAITEGNYNINNLVTVLKSLLPGFTITYDPIKNKLTFGYTGDFIFLASSTSLKILGFELNTVYFSTSSTLTSVNCVDIYTIKSIQINSNLITYNINKTLKNNQTILCSIPINSQPFSMINYINTNNYRTNLFMNYISTIKINLTDEVGNIINLNGCHYNLTLQIDVVQFT